MRTRRQSVSRSATTLNPMHSELTNLLPLPRQHALSRDYLLRRGTVIVALLTVLILVAAILLLPTYVFLVGSASAKETRLAHIESAFSSADEAALSARLATLSNNATTLATLALAPSASTIIRTALAVSRPGITLSGFTYTPAIAKKLGTLAVSGSSATREALRGYQLALQSAPFALSADLPVSVYAKDSDIAFTVTVTLAP